MGELDVHHGRLVDDEQVALKGTAAVALEPPARRVLEEPWIVLASPPVVSAIRRAPRPVGAARSA